jgi:hypothetical protein
MELSVVLCVDWQHSIAQLGRVGSEVLGIVERENHILVGIEIRRANFRWEVTSLALSIARWVHSSTMAAFPEAPL